MASVRAIWRKGLLKAAVLALSASGAGACAANPLAVGKIDQASPVAADVAAAEHVSGPYPRFSRVPPTPTDVRPVKAWRTAVYDAWALKKQTEAQAAAIPFVLTIGDAQEWGQIERAKIPAAEMIAPAGDVSGEAEAYAAAQRARATPPPPPK